MKIAICDDDPLFRSNMITLCRRYEESKKNCSFEIIEFSNGEDLLPVAHKVDMIFLDIELPGMSGIEVKETLYQMNVTPVIIYLTNHQELMQHAFGISVCGFIMKPVDEDYFFAIFERAIKLCSMNCIIEVGDKMSPNYLNSKKVLYIESDKVYTNVITKEHTYLMRKSLSEWEEELKDYGFYRIHKSYIVNFQNIVKVDKTVVLTNKKELKISRYAKKEFLELYNQYQRKTARYV